MALKVPGVTELGETGEAFTAEILEERPDPKGALGKTAFFDLEVLEGFKVPLTVRTFRAGDRMTPLGMGGVKKVQDIFVDDKVAKVQELACRSLSQAKRFFGSRGSDNPKRQSLAQRLKRRSSLRGVIRNKQIYFDTFRP